MPKHSNYTRPIKKPTTPVIHPMWRGIGCIFMVVIPIVSFFVSNLLIKNDAKISWFGIPPEILLPRFIDPLILVRILFTAIISLVLFFLISLITFILNMIFNPKQKGPYDL